MDQKDWLELRQINKVEFCEVFFNTLTKDTLDILKKFYHHEAVLEDPIGKHQNLDKITRYYKLMYQNIKMIRFDFEKGISHGNTICLFWEMNFKNSKLKSGELVKVKGCSKIVFDPNTQLVMYHRDYFDMGAMVYEHLPIYGYITRKIKKSFKSD